MKLQNFVKAFLGEASPTQIILASLLGAMLGFLPGFSQAPGLIVSLCLLLLVFNCNLALAGIIEISARLLSLVLLPLSFEFGRILLDGPTQGLFIWLINAPVSALFGFEYYATTGGLFIGAFVGLAFGYTLSRWVTGLRRRLAYAEANSDTFRAIISKPVTRFALRLFFGKIPTSDYAKLLDAKAAPIRTWGVILILALIPMVYLASTWLDGPAARRLLQANLERANGATVDLESADLDLASGHLSLKGLAISDPKALDTDLFRAENVVMNISTSDLLRRRARIEEIEVKAGSHGKSRKTPGRRVTEEPPDAPESTDETSEAGDSFELDEDWRGRLQQARVWFDKLSNHSSGNVLGGASSPSPTSEPEEMGLEEWLDREIQAQGRVHVSADHLIQGAPLLQIDRIHAPGTTTTLMPDELLDIDLRNISTQPHLVEAGPSLGIESESGNMELALALNGASAGGGTNHLRLVLTDLPAEDLAGSLEALTGKVRGGKVDLRVEGDIENRNGAWIDFPVAITLKDSSVRFSGREIPIDRLDVPVQLRGPIDDLDINVNQDTLVASITKAAAGALPGVALDMVGKGMGKATGGLSDKVGEEAGGILDELGGKKGIGNLFGR